MQYYMYFGPAVKKWLSVARNKILYRIERAIDKEKCETLAGSTFNVKFSPSSLDVSNCFTQISQFWRRLGRDEIVVRLFLVNTRLSNCSL